MKLKRMLSTVLVIAMVFGCIGVRNLAAAASGAAGFQELTLADFGMGDMEITSGMDGRKSTDTLDGTAVTLNVTFPKTKGNYLYIGGKSKGIRFAPQDDGTIILAHARNASVATKLATLDAATAGVESLTETEIKLRVTFEFSNEASGKADLKLGVYINDKLYNDAYITKTGRSLSTLQQAISFTVKSGSVIKVTDPNFVPEEMPAGLRGTTTNNYGIVGGKITSRRGINNGSIMNTLFSAYVTFPDENMWLQYGGLGTEENDDWKGMRFYRKGKDLILEQSAGEFGWSYENRMMTLSSTLAKIDFANERFLLQITTEAVDHDGDGEKDDVKLGLWFNGMLYRNSYIYANDCVKNLGNNFAVFNVGASGDAGIILEPYFVVPQEPEKLPTHLQRTTFGDMNISDGKTFWSTGFNQGTILGTLFSGYVTFHGANMWLQYGGTGTNPWIGMRFACDGEKIVLGHSDREFTGAYEFTSDIAGTELIDNRFLLQLSAEAVDHDGDGQKDDVKLGVWFNGVLYNNMYIYLLDCVDRLGNNMALLQMNQSMEEGYAIVESYLQREETLQTIPTDLPVYTFTDYNVAERTTNWLPKLKSGTIVDSMFAGYFTVTGNMWFQYGGKGTEEHSFWYGIRMDFDGEKMVLSSSNGEFRGKYTFTSDAAGTQLYDNRFLLQLTTRRCDSDNDGEADDVQLGVWFNGVLYNNTYIYLVDAAEKLGRNMAVIQPQQKPENGHALIEPIKKKVDLSRYGFDENWARTLGLR